jgi:hypothetical protein
MSIVVRAALKAWLLPIFTPVPKLRIGDELQSSEWLVKGRPWNTANSEQRSPVSAICLGSMMWGQQNSEPKAMRNWIMRSIAASISSTRRKSFHSAAAKTQGSSERIIGSWLAARKNRDKAIIAPKSPAAATQLAASGRGTARRQNATPRSRIVKRCRPTTSISINCIGRIVRRRFGRRRHGLSTPDEARETD